MADSVEPTNEEVTPEAEAEVEAHAALELQEIDNAPGYQEVQDPAMGSTVSLAACA